MEREKGFEPSASSLGSWHSTTELLPLAFESATSLIPNHLHETVEVSKVSEIHQIYPVWSKNGHQNGHQAQPENVGVPTLRFGVHLGVHSPPENGFSHTIPQGMLSQALERQQSGETVVGLDSSS